MFTLPTGKLCLGVSSEFASLHLLADFSLLDKKRFPQPVAEVISTPVFKICKKAHKTVQTRVL